MRSLRSQILLLTVVAVLCMLSSSAQAFWIWTPESGKWVNPKYSVKPSPQEQLAFADKFLANRRYGEATREYKKLLKAYPKSREAAQAQFNIGQSWEALGKYYQAVENYQKVVERYPFSDLGPQVVERQFAIANMFLEGKAKDSHFAGSLLGGDYNVTDVFRKVIKNDPYGPYAPVAQYKIGLFYLEKMEYQTARDEFEKTANDYPDSKWAESARYQIAVADSKRSVAAQYDQKVTSVAVEGFEQFVAENPDSELSSSAKAEVAKLRLKEAENAFLVASFYEKNSKFSAAKIYYKVVVDNYAGTTWAQQAEAKIKSIGDRSN